MTKQYNSQEKRFDIITQAISKLNIGENAVIHLTADEKKIIYLEPDQTSYVETIYKN